MRLKIKKSSMDTENSLMEDVNDGSSQASKWMARLTSGRNNSAVGKWQRGVGGGIFRNS